MKKLIIIGLSIALVIAVAVYFYVFHKPARTGASEAAKYSITAIDLVAAFEGNEASANAKYLNQVLKVNGVINIVNETKDDITINLSSKGLGNVICSFDKKAIDIQKVGVGQKIFVKGICSGYLMDVVLNKCAMVSQDTE